MRYNSVNALCWGSCSQRDLTHTHSQNLGLSTYIYCIYLAYSNLFNWLRFVTFFFIIDNVARCLLCLLLVFVGVFLAVFHSYRVSCRRFSARIREQEEKTRPHCATSQENLKISTHITPKTWTRLRRESALPQPPFSRTLLRSFALSPLLRRRIIGTRAASCMTFTMSVQRERERESTEV